MAITKIHAVKATVHKAIAYICNPHKTDDGILISSFGCSPETAAYDFRFALSKTKQSDPNQAFHLIQSFAPDEVSFKEAHKVGVELADKLLDGKYSYVVTTHIDRGHVHNHIIFCAADNIEHGKYHDCKQSYRRIRNLSDTLCAQHGLSVLPETNQHGKSYKTWLNDRQLATWKTTLKTHIDEAILRAQSYEDFCNIIRADGYEIKGEQLADSGNPDTQKIPKYIAFRSPDMSSFIRGNERSLGADYTKERIRERISDRLAGRAIPQLAPPTQTASVLPVRKKHIVSDYGKKALIDTAEEKYAQSPGLKHWADIQNLKIAAASYSAADSISELKQQLAKRQTRAKQARTELVAIEHQLKDFGQLLKYAEQYKENRIYHVRYEKSKDKDAYLRRHESALTLYDGAENMLRRLGIDTKSLDAEQIRQDYQSLASRKTALQKEYKAAERETSDLERRLSNLNRYLKRNSVEISVSRDSQKDKPTR